MHDDSRQVPSQTIEPFAPGTAQLMATARRHARIGRRRRRPRGTPPADGCRAWTTDPM
jgi:hypothetical protein